MSVDSRGKADLLPFEGGREVYEPRPAPRFGPRRIILAKGSAATPKRLAMVDAICSLYPDAEIEEKLEVSHSRLDLGSAEPLALHYRGKQTLVFGEHSSALNLSEESGNTCPNYWHFSPYGFCPFDCKYCYLAGTQGIRFSPTVKIFVNLDEILDKIDDQARRIGRPTAFYLGKLQDGLALDPLTGYSREMIPFFARHPFARLRLLTKATCVENLLDLDHNGHTTLSWSLNPDIVCREFEANTPRVGQRIEAMRRCAAAGYPVRAVIMPIIPIPDWQDHYTTFLDGLLRQVPLDRITLGGICIYQPAKRLMEAKLTKQNAISQAVGRHTARPPDGRARYPIRQRISIYRHLIDTIRERQPTLEPALCLEEQAVFEALDMTPNIGRCNCVL